MRTRAAWLTEMADRPTTLFGTSANNDARGDFIRSMRWIAIAGVLMVAGALWYMSLFGPLTLHTVLATTLGRSEEHTSELQSLMRISYAVFCLNEKTLMR